jgi:hypothetical protein
MYNDASNVNQESISELAHLIITNTTKITEVFSEAVSRRNAGKAAARHLKVKY